MTNSVGNILQFEDVAELAGQNMPFEIVSSASDDGFSQVELEDYIHIVCIEAVIHILFFFG